MKTTMAIVAQNFVSRGMTASDITHAMRVGTKFAYLAGEEIAVIQVG